jgi:hypothetical protein
MEKIENRSAIEYVLYNLWKNHIGKYAYFTYNLGGKEKIVAFYIQEVKMSDDKAKIKMSRVSIADGKIIGSKYDRLILIRSIRDKWNIVNEIELKKILILENLEED